MINRKKLQNLNFVNSASLIAWLERLGGTKSIWNKCTIFISHLVNCYIKPEFPWKVLKFVFQIKLLDTCSSFSIVFKQKDKGTKVFRYRKMIWQKKYLWASLGCRLDCNLFFGPPYRSIYRSIYLSIYLFIYIF